MTTSPVKAIREFCLQCCGDDVAGVRDCTSTICPLKPFRFGKNPYVKRSLTEEQKEAAKVRLAEARERKKHADHDEPV
jgi:transposase-like protein